MKKLRVAALMLAMLLLTLTMAACNSADKVSVNCNVSVMVNDEYIVDNYAYTVTGTSENPPTVLQAVREACQALDIATEVDDAGLSLLSVTSDGETYANGNDDENMYMWLYTVDGVEPDSGRAGTNTVQEGQSICFTFHAEPINPQEFSDGDE